MNEALGKDLVLIPVKIQNNDTISFLFKANNLIVYNDYEPIRIMDKKEFYRNAKTKTIKYYAIGTIGLIMGVGKSSEGIEINYYHPGRLLTVFAIWQLFKAKKLNKSLKKDLDKYYLDNIVIQPKGFIERYVCVNVGEPKNLTLQIK